MSAPTWTTALRPCPFCGQPPSYYTRPATPGEPGAFVAFIACLLCCNGFKRADGATAADAERQAADAWNKRQGGQS